jgi:PAS domain S-box-containing protein
VKTGQVVFSRQWKAMLGYGEKEIGCGYREWEKRIHPEDLTDALDKVRGYLEGRHDTYVNEFRMRCKDGTWKWVLARGMITSRDASGHPLRMIGTHSDITGRRAAREREARNLALVAKGAPVPEILDAIVSSVEAEHPGMICCVMLADPVTGELLNAASPSLPASYRRAISRSRPGLVLSCYGSAMRSRQRVVVRDIMTRKNRAPNCESAVAAGLRSCWVEPITSGAGVVLGAFACHYRRPHAPTSDEVRSITASAHLVAVAVERVRREEALRESEERLRLSARSAKQGMWDFNIITRKAVVSPEYATMLGYEADGFTETYLKWAARIHPEDRARVEKEYRSYVSGRQKEYSVEFRLRTVDGGWKWILSNGEITARDARGRPIRMSGTHTDISAVKEHEAALRESEERHRFLADNTADIVILSDAAGQALYISPSFFRITGWSRKRVDLEGWAFSIHPDDKPLIQRSRRKNLRGGETTVEWRIRQRSGAFLWMECHCKPIRSPDGKIWRLLMRAHDITKRKKAEQDYRRELEFNRVLVNHTSAIIIVMDDRGRVLHLNPAAVRELGFKLEEVVGLTPWDSGFLSPEESQRTKELYARLITGEHVPACEVRVQARDGIWHTIEIHSSCTWKANGDVDRVIVTGTDITERNRLQSEILKISEQEHARIGNDLHDGVGQTLTGIASLMDALELELSGAQKEAAGRVRNLMREAILEVRRMSHGLSPTGVRHRGLAGALTLLAETVRTNHRTKCECEIDPEVKINDAEKETHLYRIAQEAVNNSLRHGHPSLVRILLKRDSMDQAVLQIEDDGVGFNKTAETNNHNGIGVRVMDYRASLIGGVLHIQTGARGRGVRLVCRFPFAVEESASSSKAGRK